MTVVDEAAAGAGVAGAAAGALVGAGAVATAPSSMVPMTSPTEASAPASALMLVRVPLTGAGTSSVTLSVSIRTRISSALICSPTFFVHSLICTSVMDSPAGGTMISTGMVSLLLCHFRMRLYEACDVGFLKLSVLLTLERG